MKMPLNCVPSAPQSGSHDSCNTPCLSISAGLFNVAATIAFAEFSGTQDDEVPAARELAQRYGLQHHVRTVTRAEFERDIPAILDSIDQPSRDGVNTWYAAKFTAELGLKVVVSGVGGDELLYGYSSFTELPALVATWRRMGIVPGLQAAAGAALRVRSRISNNARWAILPCCAESLYGAYFLRRGFFAPTDLPALMGQELSRVALAGTGPIDIVRGGAGPIPADMAAAVGQMESMLYLRNQLLRDSDWASMAHSIELRTPLADASLLHDLTPVVRSFGRLHGKRLLARSPRIPLTDRLIRRRKTGFGLPIDKWLTDGRTVQAFRVPDPIHRSVWSARWAQVVSAMAYED